MNWVDLLLVLAEVVDGNAGEVIVEDPADAPDHIDQN